MSSPKLGPKVLDWVEIFGQKYQQMAPISDDVLQIQETNSQKRYLAAKIRPYDYSETEDEIRVLRHMATTLPWSRGYCRFIMRMIDCYDGVCKPKDTRRWTVMVLEPKCDSTLMNQVVRGHEHAQQRIFFSAALAMFQLHEANMVHCDIKPDNIGYITTAKGGLACLIDHGQVTQVDVQTIRCTAFKGTPPWRSPESECPGKHFGKPSDIWSLGCTFYYVMLGKIPHIRQRPASDRYPYGPFAYCDDSLKRCDDTDPNSAVFAEDLAGDRRRALNQLAASRAELKDWSRNSGKSLLAREVCSLVEQMLEPDAEQRLTAAEVCSHPAFDTLRQDEEFQYY